MPQDASNGGCVETAELGYRTVRALHRTTSRAGPHPRALFSSEPECQDTSS